ncbi:catalase family peroxidase [Lentzea albida]|uniref:Catalase-related peroxidase n=1 Tax=Lentzea albida TaxID=65499 RepID=A0A1H9J6I2_9PSEU|nr:catalase family peroxidase [Lentzea albida]SEQ82406.1 catalase [Lentzea albida]
MSSELAKSQISSTIVDAIEELKGTHHGFRRAHARGFVYEATFTPNGSAAPFTTAPHLQGSPVRATVRLSHTDANPHAFDSDRSVRGFATKFHLADGTNTDLVMVNVERFVAATPEEFVDFIKAAKADTDAADPSVPHIKSFVGAHPTVGPALAAAKSVGIPESYGTSQYWAIHAFLWRDAAGEVRPVRYSWVPDAGVVNAADSSSWTPHHLTEELRSRLPISFVLRVTFGEPGDPTHDSTVAWPDDRRSVDVGRIEITAEAADQEHWQSQVFDPTALVDGIEVSDDPVLAARSTIYAVSYDRRSHQR